MAAPVGGIAQEGDHIGFGVAGVNPAKAVGREVHLVERRFPVVDLVQVAYQLLQATMSGMIEQEPIQALVGVPLRTLSPLAAHEQQLLARMGPLVSEERSQVGELAPVITGHLGQQ